MYHQLIHLFESDIKNLYLTNKNLLPDTENVSNRIGILYPSFDTVKDDVIQITIAQVQQESGTVVTQQEVTDIIQKLKNRKEAGINIKLIIK